MRAMLWVGCASTVIAIGLVVGMVISRSVVTWIWTSNDYASRHADAMLTLIKCEAQQVVLANKIVQAMQRDRRSADISQNLADRLQALPSGRLNILNDFSVWHSWTLYKSDVSPSSDNAEAVMLARREHSVFGARLMRFEASSQFRNQDRVPAYYVAADGSLSLSRMVSPDIPMHAGAINVSPGLLAMRDRFDNLDQQAVPVTQDPYWTKPYFHPLMQERIMTAFLPVRGQEGVLRGFIAKDLEIF